ncbi:hypothetical protein ACN47E_004205 [Coniothyrium glycines]
MALFQRSARCFFAAFYRWNLHTGHPRICVLTSRTHTRIARNVQHARAFSKIARLQEHAPAEVQSENKVKIVQGNGSDGTQKVTVAQSSANAHVDLTEALTEDIELAHLKDSVRELLRNVPGSVAVITAPSMDSELMKHVPLGVAVSSLSSVTLDPPTVSFNLKQHSKTLDAIRDNNGLFRVHYLEANRGGAQVTELFCHGNHHEAYRMRKNDIRMHIPWNKKDPRDSKSKAPQIWHDSVRAALECTVIHELPVADHVILVAKVDTVERKKLNKPTLGYVQGRFVRPDGSVIETTRGARAITSDSDLGLLWNFPLVPEKQHRWEYALAIKEFIIKAGGVDLHKATKAVLRDIELKFPYSPQALGINMGKIVSDFKHYRSNKPERSPEKLSMSGVEYLYDFYGRLNSADRSVIINRALKIVQQLPLTLELPVIDFFQTLGMSPLTRDILASDILKPLRAAKLVDPFRPQDSSELMISNILDLEQAEYRWRGYYKTLEYARASTIRTEEVVVQLGLPKIVKLFFRKNRYRMLALTHPEEFETVDISGDVNEDEIRVILSRLRHYLFIRTVDMFRKRSTLDPNEILRRIHVHPTITGLDIEFLHAKIMHIYYSTPLFRNFAAAFDEMLEPWFISTTTWSDLEARVKDFVRKYPLRATQWSLRDKLAAIGLTWEAEVTIPEQTAPQPLNQGHILDTLVAKELRDFYGRGTELENKAIAAFLKDKYDFDVVQKTEPANSDVLSGSSSDEMEATMRQHLHVDVTRRKNDEDPSQGEMEEQMTFRRQGVERPRRSENQSAYARSNGNQRRKRTKSHTGSQASWSSYSLNGEKKQWGDQ